MNVVVSVALDGEDLWRDLELPVGRPLAELLPVLVQVVAPDGDAASGWELLASPQGGQLDLGRTLAEAEVWDGAWLLLRRRLDPTS